MLNPHIFRAYDVRGRVGSDINPEVFRLVGGRYELVPANDRGHFPIESMDVELGLWPGRFLNMTMTWLRWWDADGQLLPAPEEAVSEGERQFSAMAIVADTESLTPPCGTCRQIIWEFCRGATIVLANLHGESETDTIQDLLPRAFDARFLKEATRQKS